MITLVSGLSTTKTSWAAGRDIPTCEAVLDSCDKALEAKKREIDLSDLGIKLRSDEIERLSKENSELRSKGSSLWSNHFLWATIGLFVGSRIVR